MQRFATLVLFGLPALALPACDAGRENPGRIGDTTGAIFGWSCSDAGCVITLLPETPAPPDCGTGSFYGCFAGRLLVVCAATPAATGDGWSALPSMCRATACERDADCPLWQGSTYSCTNGLCQLPDRALDGGDIIALCLADASRAASCTAADGGAAEQEAEDLAAAACTVPGGSCTVPASCRQP